MNLDGFTTAELQQLRQRADTFRILAGDELTRRFIVAATREVDATILARAGSSQVAELTR